MGVDAEEVSRLWFNEQQQHIDGAWMVPIGAPVPTTEFINYGGVIHEALRQLVAWVEQDQAPSPSSRFEYTRDSKVILEEETAIRGGVQLKIRISGNGAAGRLDVKVGEPVELVALAEAIPGTGSIVSLEWDFEGLGTWPECVDDIAQGSTRLEHRTCHVFNKPRKYFPSCRVTTQFSGKNSAQHFRIANLGRMRVVVT